MLLAPAATIKADVPTHTQKRLANLTALRLIEEYESYASLRNDEAEDNFRYIFNNDSIRIFNDLPGLSVEDSIDIDSYISLMRDQQGKLVRIANIRGGEIIDDGDKWLLPVAFDKVMQYNTPCGAVISSSVYYDGKPYAMEALIEVDKDTYEAHIRSLHGSIDSKREPLAPGFAIANLADPRDSLVTNNGKRLKFSRSFNQAFITPPFNLEFADDDVNMKVIPSGDDKCRQFSFEYHPTRWRVRPNVDIALGGAYKVDAADGVESSASGMSFGIDFGYVLPSSSKLKIGIFTGLGLSTGKIDLSARDLSYNYSAGANADMDGDTYIRYYELSGLTQSVKLNHFSMPFYVDLEYRASTRVSVFADLGVKAYFNAGSKIDSFTGDIYSYGVYPQYDNLMMNQSWLNHFGHSSLSVDDITADSPFKGFSADILAGIGARVKIVGPLSIDLALMYQAPIIDRIDSTDARTLPAGSIYESAAPVRYTVAAGQYAEYTLLDYCKIKSNPLKLKIGLVYKF